MYETHNAPRSQNTPHPGSGQASRWSLGRRGATAPCGAPQGWHPSSCSWWRRTQLPADDVDAATLSFLTARARWKTGGRSTRRRRQRGGRSRTQRKQRGWSSARWSTCLGRFAQPSRRVGSVLSPGSSLRPLRGGRGRRGERGRCRRLLLLGNKRWYVTRAVDNSFSTGESCPWQSKFCPELHWDQPTHRR